MGCTKETKLCNWGKSAPLNPCCIDHLKELILYVDRLFKAHGIPYWIDFGTLLGMYREKDIIKHDYDADCSIDIAYTDKITALSDQIKKDGYVLDSSEQDVVQRIYYSDINKLHLDVFTFRSNNGVMESLYHPRYDFLCDYIDPMGEIDCWGHTFPAPNDVRRFLAMRYGDDFMTPRPNYLGPLRRDTHDGSDLK